MIIKQAIKIFWTLLAVFCLLQTAEAGSIDNSAIMKEFIERTPFVADEQLYLIEKISSIISSDELLSPVRWVASRDDKVYSFVMTQVQKSEHPSIKTRLEQLARRTSQMRAICYLYLHMITPERKIRYQNEEVLGEALNEWDQNRRLKANFFTMVSGDWAFAVSQASRESVDMISEQFNEMDESSLDEVYCRARIPQARELFKQELYAMALPIYQEIREMRKGEAVDYLDMAESFLRTGDKKNAVKTAEGALAEFEESINSLVLERGADIFFEIGEEELALRYYTQAIEKLHTEQPEVQR